MRRYGGLLLAVLVVGARAGPTGSRWEANKCAGSCVDAGKFAYTAGRTYVYDYSADVETTLAGATDQASRLHLTATAQITANSGCDFTMRLSGVTLKDSEPNDANSRQEVENMASFQQELERFPVSFSFQDGRIESVCATTSEPVWVLNIKRGLLSVFVNSLPSLEAGETRRTETDVAGECIADYSTAEHGSKLLVTKTKDLLKCSGRGHLISSLQTTPYSSDSPVQSLPLLQSTLKCEQKIADGRVQRVECHETHLFRPFSHGDNGAVTRSVVILTETNVIAASRNYYDDEPTVSTSLLFDHADPEVTSLNRLEAAVGLLHELEEKTTDDVRPDVPRLFTRLVHTLRHLDETHLTQLERQLAAGPTRRYLVDALPLAGTAPAMALMRQLMQRGVVTDATADRWMTALAFVHEPSAQMVAAVAPLADAADARRQTLLGVSSLVHHYCQRRPDCIGEPAVRRVVAGLERHLRAGCTTRSESEELHVLTALKALGNAGRLTGDGGALRSCFQNENTMDVRLAAIRAFRRMPCGVLADSGLMSAFASGSEETEVRVAAYLAVMRCPTHAIVDKVQQILQEEEVNQVSSFVWSHLSNMQETRDPTKQYMKSLLYNLDLANKFKSDVRKFSRYVEKTVFSESMNAGATVDGSVVFSPESFIPRSGMLNFTVDLFGEAINLLEVGGRAEGLEDLSESLFGSNGLYPQAAISKIMQTMRGRQSNDLTTYTAGNRIETPRASAYVKIFGNELRFGKFDSLKELISSLGANGPLDFLQKLGKDMDWTENFQFLDSTYTVPTVVGLPFSLKAVGSAAVSLKTGGSFDIQSWNKMNINGFVKPSAAVEIVSEMTVDAHVARTGLKMNTNLHTSTVFDGHAIVESAKVVSVRFNMPRDKVEVLDVTTRFHTVHRNRNSKLEMHAGGRYDLQVCSDRYIDPALFGVNLCADVMYSRGTDSLPSMLLSGPITASFVIEKTDTIDAFLFEYRHFNEAGVRKSRLAIDTPGSAINRHISLDYMIDFRQQAFQVGFRTPIKSAQMVGGLYLHSPTKRLFASLKVDDRELFGWDSQLAIDEKPTTVRYTPSFTLRGPAGEIVSLESDFIGSTSKHKYSGHVTISKLFQTPVTWNGQLNEAGGTYNMASSMTSFLLDGDMKGSFRAVDGSLFLLTNSEYSVLGGERHTVQIDAKAGETAVDDETTYLLSMSTKFSALPMLDAQLDLKGQTALERYSSELRLTRGERVYVLSGAANVGDTPGVSVGFVARHWDVDFKLAGALDMSKDDRMVVNLEGQLCEATAVKVTLGVDYKSEMYNFNYGIFGSLDTVPHQYTFATGVRWEKTAGHLKLMATHATADKHDELALVAALELADAKTEAELTVSAPGWPRLHASGALVRGVDGQYLARAAARAGRHHYAVSGDYTLRPHHRLQLLLEAPGRHYSADVTALLAGFQPSVTADLRFGRRVTITLLAEPYAEEKVGSFEVYWDKDADETQKASVGVQWRKEVASATLSYPGRDVRLNGIYTGTGVVADLEYAPGHVIHAAGEVHWDHPDGLLASARIDTPLAGYRTLSLTLRPRTDQLGRPDTANYEVVGHLEEREARLVARLLVEQGYLTMNLQTELDLLLPIRGWEHSKLAVSWLMNPDVFAARALVAKNSDEIAVGGTLEHALWSMPDRPQSLRINAAFDIVLPIDVLRNAKVGFNLEMSKENVNADALVRWKNYRENELSLTMTCAHRLDRNVLIDSTLTLKTPFENLEQWSSNLQVNTEDTIMAQINLLKTQSEIFFSKLVFSASNGAGTADAGQFLARWAGSPGVNLAYELHSSQGEDGRYNFTVATNWIGQTATLTSAGTLAAMDRDTTTILTLPFHTYKFIERIAVDMDAMTASNYLELSRDDQKITVDMDVTIKTVRDSETGRMTSITHTGFGKVTTPFENWESAQITQNTVILSSDTISINSETQVFTGDKVIKCVDRYVIQDIVNWKFEREITSNTRFMSSWTYLLQLSTADHHQTAELIVSMNHDGNTGKLVYLHSLPENTHDGRFNMYATIKSFDGVVRSLKIEAPLTPEAIHPSLSLTYGEGQTIQIYGIIVTSLGTGSSHLTLEAPFTDKLFLSVDHKCRRDSNKVHVKYLHGSKLYSADVKVKHNFPAEAKLEVEFVSPRNCMGTGKAIFEYALDSQLELKGKLIHNDWEILLKGEMGFENGHVDIDTPYQDFTSLSASYSLGSNAAELRLKRENRQILVAVQDHSTDSMLAGSMRITTPYDGFEVMTLTVNKPKFQDTITAEYARGRHTAISATVEYSLSGPSSSVSLKTRSSLAGFSTAELLLSYDLAAQAAKVAIAKEGRSIEVDLTAHFRTLYSKLAFEYHNTLVGGPRSLTLNTMHDVRNAKTFKIVATKNTDKFAVSGDTQLSLDSSFVKLNIDTPMRGYENIKIIAEHAWSKDSLTMKLEGSRNEEAVTATFIARNADNIWDMILSLQIPFETYRNMQLSLGYDVTSFVRTQLGAQRDSVKYEATFSMEVREDVTIITVTTPFPTIENMGMRFETSTIGSKKYARILLNRNQDQIEAEFESEFHWFKSNIGFKVTSPFEQLKKLHFAMEYDLDNEQKSCFALFTHNDQNVQINIFSIVKYGMANGVIQLRTPFRGWKDVKIEARYDFTHNEKSMEISYERDGARTVIASRGAYDGESAYADLITPIKDYERIGLSGQFVSRRGKREAGYEVHVNDHRHRVYVLYERHGLESAKLRIESPVENFHLIELEIRSQVFDDGYGIYITTNRDGKHSSAELRTVRDDKSVSVAATIHSYLAGLEHMEISGSIIYRGRKRSFSFKSSRDGRKAEISGEVTIKKRNGKGTLKASLPFEGFEDVDITFNYKTGNKKSFTLTSTRGGVSKEFSGDLQYSDNGFTINLKTPYNGFKKLHADASRSKGPDGKIKADITLERGAKKITIGYEYLFTKKSGSAGFQATTPYDNFNTLKSSLEYEINPKSRSFSFKASRDARAWSLETHRTWGDGVGEASLEITSPIDEIKSVKIVRSFSINDLTNIVYSASYKRNDKKFSVSVTGSILDSGKKVSFDVTIKTPIRPKKLTAKLDYDFRQYPWTISAGVTAGSKNADIVASLGKTAGSVTLTTTNAKLPKAEITYSVTLTASERTIQADLTLPNDRHLNVELVTSKGKKYEISGKLAVVSTTYGDRLVTWAYSYPGDDLDASFKYESPNVNLDLSLTVDGKRYQRRKIVFKSSITSELYTSKQTTTLNYNRKNGLYVKAKVNYNGKIYLLTFDAKKRDGKRVVSITYDGQLLKDIEIDGTWTIPTDLETPKSFDLKYKRGGKKATLKGSLLLSSSLKSGSFHIEAATPLAKLANLDVTLTWNVVLPNRELIIDYNRNGKRVGINFSGSRSPKKADYSLTISTPPVKLITGKPIKEFKWTLSYDFQKDYKFQVGRLTPQRETFEFGFKRSGKVRRVEIRYYFDNKNGLVSQLPSEVDIEFNSKRTDRANGPKIEAGLLTSFPGFEEISVDIDVNRGPSATTVEVDYKRGERIGKLVGKLTKNENGGSISVDLQTPFAGYGDISASGSYEAEHGKSYGLNLNYVRGQKYVRVKSSTKINIVRSGGLLQSGSIDGEFKFDSHITRPIDLLVTVDGSVESQPRRSGTGKVVVTFNSKTASLSYAVERPEPGRRTSRLVVTTPLKAPFKKLIYTTDVSLPTNKASISVDYGKKIVADLSWLAGEASQYGAELRLKTPYKQVRSLELDVKGTLQHDNTMDVLVHYRRGEKMVHVTGNLRLYALDLDFVTPTYGNFNVKAGLTYVEGAVKVEALWTNDAGAGRGGSVTVKAVSMQDMQVTVDLLLGLAGYERVNVDLAYTNKEDSNIVRVAFESPFTKRVELAFELTNRTDDDKTDFRAGITTNYLGKAFTINTKVQRDASGMKYELEIESPLHIFPSLKLTGRR